MTSNDIAEILISCDEIYMRNQKLSKEIEFDYDGKVISVLCVLKGAYRFMTDLTSMIDLPMEINFITLSSYGNEMKSSGQVQIVQDLRQNFAGKNVLIIEDIIETGTTLSFLHKYLAEQGATDVKTAVLLRKKDKIKTNVKIDYVGFDIGNEFVVGYGLDYKNQYRNLPNIGILKQDVIDSE